MLTRIALTVLCCTLGLGASYAVADGNDKPVPKTSTSTLTLTTIDQPVPVTVTVTTPAPAPVTVTTPAVTVTTPGVTVTTPGKVIVRGKPTCAHGDWDIWAPRCRPKLIVACKGQYRREILRWCLRYEKPPKVKGKESVQRVGGVTG